MIEPKRVIEILVTVYGSMTLAEFCRLEYEVGTSQRALPRQPRDRRHHEYEAHQVAFHIAKRFYPTNVVPSFAVLHGPFIPSRALDRLTTLAEIDLAGLMADDDARFTPIAQRILFQSESEG